MPAKPRNFCAVAAVAMAGTIPANSAEAPTPPYRVSVALPDSAPDSDAVSSVDPVDDVVEKFRLSFRHRVSSGRQTLFNQCFTRFSAGEEMPPSIWAVSAIRNGSARMVPASQIKTGIDFSKQPIVVLDAGHGGEGDPGAVRDGLRESVIVDSVVPHLETALGKRGALVISTRSPVTQGGLSRSYRFANQDRALQWRAELSHELATKFPDRPVLFLSIHANSSPSPISSGAEIYYYAADSGQSASAQFARSVATHFKPQGGVRLMRGDFAVLRCQKAQTPAILIELSYITNIDDREFLRSLVRNPHRAEAVAEKIAQGVQAYVQHQHDKQEKPVVFARADIQPSTVQ